MKFAASALTVATALAAPLAASAFAPAPTFGLCKVVGPASAVVAPVSHGFACGCAACAVARHPATCTCASCSGIVALRMSDVAETDVPAEVEALDGVASDEEAHNVERPARSSLSKHKKGGKSGTALPDLEIGSSVEGTVKAVQSYGAFLDIGAQTDALLHVSRISDDFVSNVEDVVKAGDKITVRIVSVDADKGQIAVTARSEEAEKAASERGGGGC